MLQGTSEQVVGPIKKKPMANPLKEGKVKSEYVHMKLL